MTLRLMLPLCTACLALTACERVVGVSIPEGPRHLVIEARLERVIGNVNGTQAITLSTTAPYFTDTPAPPAVGAVVRVADDSGHEVTFVESAPGRYTTDQLVVRVGARYSLSVAYAGESYEATETAQSVPPIDSLYFDPPRPGRFAGTKGVRATIDVTDPAGERNFYLWDQFVNGVRQLGPDTSFKYRVTATDDAFNGLAIIGFQPYEGVEIPDGGNVLIRQIGISEDIYHFYFALSDQVSADGSPFSVPAASVRGNVANVTNPSHFPLGYFYVSQVAEARATRTP